MGEFVDNEQTASSRACCGRCFNRRSTSGMDPILELIGCLLEDGAGGVTSPMELQVTTEQWLTWNQMALSIPKALSRDDRGSFGEGTAGSPNSERIAPALGGML